MPGTGPSRGRTDDTTLTVAGSLASVNAALSGLTFVPLPGFTGTADLTIGADDPDATGLDGPKLGNAAVTVTVTDAPPPNTTEVSFVLVRQNAGQASQLPLVVVDTCNGWPTFVGGGPNAF